VRETCSPPRPSHRGAELPVHVGQRAVHPGVTVHPVDRPIAPWEEGGWSELFVEAFKLSRNPMALTDEHRRHLDVNGAYLALLGHPRDAIIGQPLWRFVAGGPRLTPAAWATMLAKGRATGDAELLRGDGSGVGVQWAAAVETVTGRQLVLVVALSSSRWGARFRRTVAEDATGARVTPRERDVIRLVALGLTGPEIADELHIAHDTVRTHVRNAMTKVGARSRAHLVAKALGGGLIEV
jgi:DNA-binding CsgD family transcriptional regulator